MYSAVCQKILNLDNFRGKPKKLYLRWMQYFVTSKVQSGLWHTALQIFIILSRKRVPRFVAFEWILEEKTIQKCQRQAFITSFFKEKTAISFDLHALKLKLVVVDLVAILERPVVKFSSVKHKILPYNYAVMITIFDWLFFLQNQSEAQV